MRDIGFERVLQLDGGILNFSTRSVARTGAAPASYSTSAGRSTRSSQRVQHEGAADHDARAANFAVQGLNASSSAALKPAARRASRLKGPRGRGASWVDVSSA